MLRTCGSELHGVRVVRVVGDADSGCCDETALILVGVARATRIGSHEIEGRFVLDAASATCASL
jgi:hypothetical protein